MRNYDWLNQNQYRRYPLKEDTPVVFEDSEQSLTLVLEAELLLDMNLTCNRPAFKYQGEELGAERFFYEYRLSHITATASEVTFYVVADGNDDSTTDIAHFVFLKNSERQTVLANTGAGWCVGQAMSSIPIGTFISEDTYLENRVVKHAAYNRVTSFEVNGVPLTGKITFGDGYNLEVNTDENTITLLAGRGYGEGEYCPDACVEPIFCDTALYGINGVLPNNAGNLLILSKKEVTIEPITNGVRIGTKIDASNLCEREGGTPGDPGPAGATGGAGPSGDPAEPQVCINTYCYDGPPPPKFIEPTPDPADIPSDVPTRLGHCCNQEGGGQVNSGNKLKAFKEGLTITETVTGTKI